VCLRRPTCEAGAHHRSNSGGASPRAFPEMPPRVTLRHVLSRKAFSGYEALWKGSSCYVVILCAVAYLCANTFLRPSVPVLLGGDQCFFWLYAERMLFGEQPYRDFFQFTPPGTDLIYLFAFVIFGTRIWVTNAVAIALGVALSCACFLGARRIAGASLAALATALFLVLAYGRSFEPTHHWFSVGTIMLAVATLSPLASRARLAAAGALLGAAAFFTLAHGAVALLAFLVYLAWQARKEGLASRVWLEQCAWLCGVFALVLAATNAYFVATVGIQTLWTYQVTYVSRMTRGSIVGAFHFARVRAWIDLLGLGADLFVASGLLVVYATVLHRSWHTHFAAPSRQWNERTLTALVGAFLLVEVAINLNLIRLVSVSLPGAMLAGWVVGRLDRFRNAVVHLLWLAAVVIAQQHVGALHRHSVEVDLPGGRAAASSQDAEVLRWLAQHTKPGDFLFAADWPLFYLPLQLRNPAFLDVVWPDESTSTGEVERCISELDRRHVSYVLLNWDNMGANARGAARLRAYLHDQYALAQAFSDGEQAWARRY
jgi:hypothetical protein